jgi:hypothetical protein
VKQLRVFRIRPDHVMWTRLEKRFTEAAFCVTMGRLALSQFPPLPFELLVPNIHFLE